MNLAQGEKLVQVLIANTAFGEVNPGYLGLQQLELITKKGSNGNLEAEMKVGYKTGTAVYKFPDLDQDGLKRVRNTFDMFFKASNQPGIFREYNFEDCKDDEEMRFRVLSIPEYRAVAAIPKEKLVSLEQVKQSLKCPVCRKHMSAAGRKCPSCGTLCYKDGRNRYFESETASFFPLLRHGETEAGIHLCKIDYINTKTKCIYPHITYIEEFPYYLGLVYTFTPPAKPMEFHVILNKPKGIRITGDFLPSPYRTKAAVSEDLDILSEHGCRLFIGSGAEPFLIVSFQVWDYTCLEEIGSHVNYILYKYNSVLEGQEGTI